MASEKIQHILLWSRVHPHFNSKFIESLDDQLNHKHTPLSNGQVAAIDNIYNKFQIEAWANTHISPPTEKKNEDDESFKEELKESFKCAICLELFADATTFKCGDTFCFVCAFKWVSLHRNCPLCRDYFPTFEYATNRCTNQAIMALLGDTDVKHNDRVQYAKHLKMAIVKGNIRYRHHMISFFHEALLSWVYLEDVD